MQTQGDEKANLPAKRFVARTPLEAKRCWENGLSLGISCGLDAWTVISGET